MPSKSFNFILNRIGHYLTHDTTASEPISLKERLEICVYGISFCDYYQTTAETTGNVLTTVRYITQEVCTVIVSKLWSESDNIPEIVEQILKAISQIDKNGNFLVNLVEWMAVVIL